MKVVTKLMLMLLQVNVFSDSNYHTLIKHSSVHLEQVTANYQPGMHTTGLSVGHVNTDFFLMTQSKDFRFSSGLSRLNVAQVFYELVLHLCASSCPSDWLWLINCSARR